VAEEKWSSVSGGAPARRRFAAFAIVGGVVLIAALILGLGGYALAPALVAGWLAVAGTDFEWRRRAKREAGAKRLGG
jgi:hypothetical protein